MTESRAQLDSISEVVEGFINDDLWSPVDRLKLISDYLSIMKKVQGMNYEETKTYFNEKANQATA